MMLKLLEMAVLKVSEKYLADLEENEFYYHEIMGCAVVIH